MLSLDEVKEKLGKQIEKEFKTKDFNVIYAMNNIDYWSIGIKLNNKDNFVDSILVFTVDSETGEIKQEIKNSDIK